MVGEICMFLKNNVDSSLPTRFQPAFNATFQTIVVTVKDWGDDVKRDVGKMLETSCQQSSTWCQSPGCMLQGLSQLLLSRAMAR